MIFLSLGKLEKFFSETSWVEAYGAYFERSRNSLKKSFGLTMNVNKKNQDWEGDMLMK